MCQALGEAAVRQEYDQKEKHPSGSRCDHLGDATGRPAWDPARQPSLVTLMEGFRVPKGEHQSLAETASQRVGGGRAETAPSRGGTEQRKEAGHWGRERVF